MGHYCSVLVVRKRTCGLCLTFSAAVLHFLGPPFVFALVTLAFFVIRVVWPCCCADRGSAFRHKFPRRLQREALVKSLNTAQLICWLQCTPISILLALGAMRILQSQHVASVVVYPAPICHSEKGKKKKQ